MKTQYNFIMKNNITDDVEDRSLLKVNGESRSQSDNRTPAVVDEPPTTYAWFCLFLILFINIGNQWQRYTIAYAYGVGGDDEYKDDETYAI